MVARRESSPTPQPRWLTPGPLRPSDALPAIALGLWLWSVRTVKLGAMDDWGLLHALPVAYFVALGLLIVSIAIQVTRETTSPVRLALHLVFLVVVLHGTVPIIFPAPNYPWVYKHIGVTNYIDARGALDPSVDIYHNWPGFFALGAWVTRMAGVGSALAFAKWAPVYFNLLFCLELAFVLRWLPLRRQERWLAMFLFTVGNWVGQDYFAPQPLAFVLCLAVCGMVLAWLRSDTRQSVGRFVRPLVEFLRRLERRKTVEARTDQDGCRGPDLSAAMRVVGLACLFFVFAAVVVTHQLSPFLVLAGVGLLTAGGLIRPWWVFMVLGAMAMGYLALNMGHLRTEGHLGGSPFNPREVIAALGNPIENFRSSGFESADPMPGRRLTALGAPALILGMWTLGAVGALRRIRAGRQVLLLLILGGSPAILALGENYGGEATFRIYLFSLPWVVALAASALFPRSGVWRPAAVVGVALALATGATLFMGAFYGSVELYRVRPGSILAAQYYFDHAPPGSVLGLLAPNAPNRLGGNYDQFVKDSPPPPLSSEQTLLSRMAREGDLSALNDFYRRYAAGTTGGVFLSMSSDQETYVRVLGLMPAGAVADLDRALADSSDWRLFYRNEDAVIYQFVPGGGPERPAR